MNSKNTPCPECKVAVGEFHAAGCDMERCPNCGGQEISCSCGEHRIQRLAWTGEFGGAAECREFGWFIKADPKLGWIACDANDPDATEDLNRLCVDAVWSPEAGRFVLRNS